LLTAYPGDDNTGMPESSMKMPKPSEEARQAFAQLVPSGPAVTVKPMFGNIAGFVNGNMFAGLFGEDLFVRLPDDEAAVVRRDGGRDFEPMTGHAMTGYVLVPNDWRDRPEAVAPLVERAMELTSRMPAKAPRKPAKKK
jgi:TfoX/Sxy family transcriptional regulator of competence genes